MAEYTVVRPIASQRECLTAVAIGNDSVSIELA
jgi:hypothetical protein